MKLTNKNKWSYSTGCVGRDMVYTMVSLFMLTYIQFAVGLSKEQFMAITAIIIACRVWDAINDPMMGTIIQNTKTRFGKYRPWILIGGIINAIILVLMFSLQLSGWTFVVVFGILYLLWGMTYTINDVSYWSLLPALAQEKKERDNLTTLVAVFASLGAFAAGGLIPMLTTGNQVVMYRMISIVIAIIFVICSISVFVLVKEESEEEVSEEKTTLKDMFKVIISNPQLLYMAIVVLLYSLGSALLNAFGQNFFYFEFSYEGNRMFIFTVVYAIGTLASQALYPTIAKHFNRSKITTLSMIVLIIGYISFFILGGIKMDDLNIKLAILCVFGVLIFVGQGVFYMNMLIMLTNTIEYDELRSGKRNEAIVFSIRPFMVKFASAIQQLIVTATLLITGLYNLSNQIAEIEKQGLSQEVTTNLANQAIQNASLNDMFVWQKFGLRFSMTIIPVILFAIAFIIIKKKYIIDEVMYEDILRQLKERKEK